MIREKTVIGIFVTHVACSIMKEDNEQSGENDSKHHNNISYKEVSRK